MRAAWWLCAGGLVQPRNDLRRALAAIAGEVAHFEALKARVQPGAHEMHFAKAGRTDRRALQMDWKMRLRRLVYWHDWSRRDKKSPLIRRSAKDPADTRSAVAAECIGCLAQAFIALARNEEWLDGEVPPTETATRRRADLRH